MDMESFELKSMIEILQGYANQVLELLPSVVLALVVLALTWVVAGLARRLTHKLSGRATEDASLRKLFGTIAHVFTVCLGIFAAAAIVFPGLKAGDLVGVLGLSSVAIGFAFKDIFQNFLAGILILTQRPFTIGDQIHEHVADIEGFVEDITIRSSKIRTTDGQLAIVPNSHLFTNAVTVRTAFDRRRTTFTTGIGYDEPLEPAREVIREAVKTCEGVLTEPAPQIYVANHGSSSVDFDIRYWTDSKQSEVSATRDRVATRVKLALDEAGIEIPYPYRTLEFLDQTDYAALLDQLDEDQRELLRALRRPDGPPTQNGASN